MCPLFLCVNTSVANSHSGTLRMICQCPICNGLSLPITVRTGLHKTLSRTINEPTATGRKGGHRRRRRTRHRTRWRRTAPARAGAKLVVSDFGLLEMPAERPPQAIVAQEIRALGDDAVSSAENLMEQHGPAQVVATAVQMFRWPGHPRKQRGVTRRKSHP